MDSHIKLTLSQHLGDTLEWTDILHELDRLKGKPPKIYSRSDIQCQLRIVTERLGSIGYPFSEGDPYRMMSIYGNELRLIRNRWAHGDSFSALEAMRAVDTVFILLTHIGDHDTATKAAEKRSLIIQELVKDSAESIDLSEAASDADEAKGNHDVSEILPETPRKGFGEISGTFQAWETVITGDVEVLDNLPKKSAKESVRSTIEEIVDFEAPIHRDRLSKLVGYTYGLGKIHDSRARRISGQIKGSGCRIDKDGFVWPGDVDPCEWKIYRTSSLGTTRPFTQISPVEIANAVVDLVTRQGEISMSDLRRLTLRTFGRRKETKGFSAHLDKAVAYALSREYIKDVNGTVCV